MSDLILPGEVPLDLLWPAICASILVIATHIPLGVQVLSRGIIFIDLTIAQVAGLGAYLVLILAGENTPAVWVQLGAVSLALGAAWGLVALERLSTQLQEPLIGVVFVLAATATILLAHGDPHGGQHLTDLLSGQILWVSATQLKFAGIGTFVILVAMYVLRANRFAFYSLFAVAITISVQLVGIYLVFTTLIIPALVVSGFTRTKKWVTAYTLAITSYVIGVLSSAWLDLPTGPLIVWSLAVTGTIVRLVMSRQLVLSRRQMAVR